MSDKYEVIQSWKVTEFPLFVEGKHYAGSSENIEDHKVNHNRMWRDLLKYRKALPQDYSVAVSKTDSETLQVELTKKIKEENNN